MGVSALRPKDRRQSDGSADDSSAGSRNGLNSGGGGGVANGSGGGPDAVDLRLLELLQSEGRITLSELGRRVNLSPAAVGERVRRLEANGTITGYAALVAPERLGYGIRAFVRVSPHARMTVKYVRSQDLLHRPEVLEVHHVIGEDCWVFKVAARDTSHLEELIEAIAVLGRTTTSVILSSPVDQRPLLPAG